MTHTLDRHNAAIARRRVDASCPRGTATIRTRDGTAKVTGTLYNRFDGEPLIVFKHAGKWYAAEIASGYSITPRGHTTRSACMIESHHIGQRTAA